MEWRIIFSDGSPSQEKFYPDTSSRKMKITEISQYSGPPPSAMMNLEKKPAKSILKSSKLSDTTRAIVPDLQVQL